MRIASSRSMFWKLFIPVAAMLLVSAIAAALYLPSVIQRNAEQEAVSAGQDTVKQFKALRKYYTENVVAKILAKGTLSVSFEHRNDPNTVPLPATMIHDLSALLKDSGTSLKLYSPFPFPNRGERVLDKFGTDAWAYFQTHPDKTFFRTESLGDKTMVRVAIADRMVDQACLNCHNTLKSSPKTDWKLNDVRGVLEVDSSKQLDSGQRLVPQVLATLSVIMLLIAFSLRFIYQRSIARPLNAALDTAQVLTEGSEEKLIAVKAIANGNLEQDFAVARVPDIDRRSLSDDEAGVLLKSIVHMSEVQAALDEAFRKMTLALRKSRSDEEARDWQKTGLNDLGDLMRGEHEPAEMADKVLGYLVQRVGSSVGAFYLYHEQSDDLAFTAGYALLRGKQLSARLRLGEGLLGQAARERKTICLTQVPSDYMSIGSALGEGVPRNVIAVPLVHGDNLVGALELGTFKAFSDAELEFLERAKEGIAIGFGVSLSRHRTHELLAQTQAQSEELRVQQEELQQSNAELEERADMLEQQREQIRQKNREVESASQELQRKAIGLEKANTYKSEFLANMSHELRTPLNSMLILSGILKDNKSQNLNDKQVEYATTINNAGQDLLNLINDILDLSKVEAGKVELHYETVSPNQLIDSLETLFKPLAEQKALSLSAEVASNVPDILHLDVGRTQQILKNLMSNAFKFTEKGGVSMRIAVPRENPLAVAAIAFAVTDTGVGVASDKHKLIFEAFKQADGGITRTYGGTGLGLSISLQLARTMGGDLGIASALGKGSTFTLFLPLSEPTHPSAAPRPAVAMPPASAAGAFTVPDDCADLHVRDKSILIVEDDVNFARILVDAVRARGFKALVALDGETGIALAQKFLPSAVLLDVTLPKVDGWGVAQSLKDSPHTQHIPVHFLTGQEDRQRAMDLGALGFVTKPVSSDQLSQVIQSIEAALAQTGKKLLIVEDNADQVKSLLALLSEHDVAVQVATSGKQAIACMEAERFDCMVLDLGLSDMTGFELLDHLQGREHALRIPVIIHSARDLTRDEERDLRRYAQSIIVKGAKSPERLLSEVTLFLHLVERTLDPTQQKSVRSSMDSDRALAGKKMLIVDDDMRNVFSLTSLLTDYGIEVVEAENGLEALSRLAQNADIHVVLMDIMMPEMDGFEAMREIRKNPRYRDLPVIAMTAKAMQGDHQKCLDAGASDYIAKPIDTQKLLSLLRVWACRS